MTDNTQPEALRDGFTAADMATASAQGFRDGVASVAASAGSEPVAWRYRSGSNGNWEDCTKEVHDMVLRAPQRWAGYEVQPLYTHPSPPEGMVGCTRSHPHENMDSACRAKAAIAEMRNMAARGAEATAHDLDRFVSMLTAALVEAQQPAKAESLRQILTDPENQPNQYGVQFLMHGAKMAFRIGNRQFCLDYEPDEPGEFEFMRDALISAFSIFTPNVKMATQPSPTPQADSQPAPVLDYPPLPDFDSGDEPIWDAIFNWNAATPGPDAHRKANAVESAIIDQLRAYVDADRAARAPADSVTAPAAGAVAGPVLWVSPGQLEVFKDTDDAPFGTYIPARKTSAGKFTMPLFAAAPTPPAQAADSVLEDAASAGFFLQLPQRPKPEAPAGTVGLDWDAYSGAQMLAYGRDCSNAAIVAAQKPGGL